jgi:hypothetical protein
MTTLSTLHSQWASRPDDQRFVTMADLHSFLVKVRDNSKTAVVSTRALQVQPVANDPKGLQVHVNSDRLPAVLAPTHWAFGQLCSLTGINGTPAAPAAYLRSLHPNLAADCLNWGLQVVRDAEDVGLLAYENGGSMLTAATGPKYGRIWNATIAASVMHNLDLSVWGVPGVFGRPLDQVTKDNTTLYTSDRDMFIFLCDETHRVAVPNRRDGKGTELYRGFYLRNSEHGACRLEVVTMYYDGICGNRYIWGAEEVQEFSIIHRAAAPDRFVEECVPALQRYANAPTGGITRAIEDARKDRLGDKVQDFLAKRFGPQIGAKIEQAHLVDEGRPIENRWDALVGATAYARQIKYQDARTTFEAEAGKLLQAA